MLLGCGLANPNFARSRLLIYASITRYRIIVGNVIVYAVRHECHLITILSTYEIHRLCSDFYYLYYIMKYQLFHAFDTVWPLNPRKRHQKVTAACQTTLSSQAATGLFAYKKFNLKSILFCRNGIQPVPPVYCVFFRFMAANLSLTQALTCSKPQKRRVSHAMLFFCIREYRSIV